MTTKPKFFTKWHNGKLVPVRVENMPGTAITRTTTINGLTIVVYVEINGKVIYLA